MKNFIKLLLFLSLVSQSNARTLEDALANSEKFLKKVEKFQEDFGKEEKTDNYPSTSKGIALGFCAAFADVDFDKMLSFCEKDSKVRLKKDLQRLRASPEYYEFKDMVLSSSIKCKIDSIEDNPKGHKTYIFKSVEVLDPVTVERVHNRFVVIDSEYIKRKKEKAPNDFMGKAKKFMQEDYGEIEKVKAYYPPTSEKLAIASCEAIRSMDWETLYSYTITSYHEKLKKNIERIENNKEEFKKDFAQYSCKIKSSDKIGKLKMKYYFGGLGSVYVEFLPALGNGWQVIRF